MVTHLQRDSVLWETSSATRAWRFGSDQSVPCRVATRDSVVFAATEVNALCDPVWLCWAVIHMFLI
jgi:hypothetical protein